MSAATVASIIMTALETLVGLLETITAKEPDVFTASDILAQQTLVRRLQQVHTKAENAIADEAAMRG